MAPFCFLGKTTSDTRAACRTTRASPFRRGDDFGGLQEPTEVPGFGEPDIQRGTEARKGEAVLRAARAGKIVDLVRIRLRVVELLIRKARGHQGQRRTRQLAFREQPPHERRD